MNKKQQKETVTNNHKLTAVEFLMEELDKNGNWFGFAEGIYDILERAKQMEKEQIVNAMLYALDEDGHTGNWKIAFVNDYYDKAFLNKK